jgi:eukaryotic-like serine/threonine-protein kinase
LCDAPNARGANWGRGRRHRRSIERPGCPFARTWGRWNTTAVTKLEGAITHRWPQPLPGNEEVLFTISSSQVAFEGASIAAVSLKTGEIKILVRGGYFGRYAPTGESTGHLLYVHEGVLWGVPFDPTRLELRGTAAPILEDLAGDPNSGAGHFSFSRTGIFVYRSGKVSAQSWPVWWLDRSGKTSQLIARPSFYIAPRFSPDGQHLVLVQVAGGSDRRVFVYDWQRDTMSRLVVNTQQLVYPTWSPDGKHILFGFRSANGSGLGWMRADGTGESQRLLDGKNIVNPYSFFPDGRRLAYWELDPDSGWDLWTLALDLSDPDRPKPGKPELFLRTPSNERNPSVSPDGRWIAYVSDESGRYEMYVRPFPGPGGKWQISNAGGQLPVWSHNGRELFFQDLANRIMVTEYEPKNESFVAGKPRLWSDQQLQDISGNPNYDLAPDGKRFAIIPEPKARAEEKGAVHVSFLLNFFDELRRRAPMDKK